MKSLPGQYRIAQVAEALDLLEQLDQEFKGTESTGGPEPRWIKVSGVHPRNQPKTYRVEHRGGASFLAEHREGGRQAFLCPEEVYDALAKVFAGATEPRHFDAIQANRGQELGEVTPDYLPRMCVRFWLNTDPPLLEKVRTRYRAVRRSSMVRDAGTEWRRLADKVEP